MAVLGSTLLSNVFAQTEAEKVLRPKIETLKDYMVYGIILLGVVLVPFTMLGTGTPINCNFCKGTDCTIMGAKYQNNKTDPGYSHWFVKSYCTMNGHIMDKDEGVKPFMLYFPFYLLFTGAVLISIEKVLHPLFGAKENMEEFYKIVINKEKRMQDVPRSKDEKLTVVTKVQKSDGTFAWANDWEMKQYFNTTRNAFAYSYFFCQLIGIGLAAFLLQYMFFIDSFGFEAQECEDNFELQLKGCHFTASSSFPCDIHGHYFECTGAPTHFFNVIKILASILVAIYTLCCLSSLNWLKPAWMQQCSLSKPFLWRLKYKLHTWYPKDKKHYDLTDVQAKTKEIVDNLEKLSTDAVLFIDLLESTSGTDKAICCLARLDSNFKDSLFPEMWFPDKTEKKLQRSGNTLKLNIKVAPSYLNETLNRMHGRLSHGETKPVYIAELIPSKDFLGTEVKMFPLPVDKGKKHMSEENSEKSKDLEKGEFNDKETLLKIAQTSKTKLPSVTFEDIKDDVSYMLKLSTVINGTIIKSKLFEVEDVI